MVSSDYGSTDLKDLEAIKPNKKEKRPPTSSLIVVLLQGVMQVGGARPASRTADERRARGDAVAACCGTVPNGVAPRRLHGDHSDGHDVRQGGRRVREYRRLACWYHGPMPA